MGGGGIRVRKELKRKRERRMLKLGKGRLGKQRGRPELNFGVRVKNGIGRDEWGGGYKPGENYFDERVHFLNIINRITAQPTTNH